MFFKEERASNDGYQKSRLYSVDVSGYNERQLATPLEASDPRLVAPQPPNFSPTPPRRALGFGGLFRVQSRANREKTAKFLQFRPESLIELTAKRANSRPIS